MSSNSETKKKDTSIIKHINLTLMFIQIVMALVLFIKLGVMGVLPTKYMILCAAVIAVINILVGLSTKKKGLAIIMAVISVLVSLGIIYAIFALFKLDSTLDKVSSDTRLETEQMSVVVLNSDAAQNIEDVAGYKIGYLDNDDAAEEMMAKVDKTITKPSEYKNFANVLFMKDALLDGTEEAIIMNNAYIDVIADLDGCEDFANQVRVLDTIDVDNYVEAEKVENKELTEEVEKVEATEADESNQLSSDKDTFIVYISGIDTFGSVSVKSRSDVNILAVVNTKTGHVQLINTPRDYYVTLPDKGAKDKLTHAGLYGVDCSINTMDNLYGINIDYYLRMNFSGFEDIIDTLGGIDVYSEYDFTVEPIKHYTVGYNHLSGIEALAFARERHSFASGDVQRGINQMAVINAMIQKMSSSEMLYKYNDILDKISDCFQTNMPSDAIYAMVQFQLANNISWKIDSYSLTGTGSHETTYSMPSTTTYVMVPSDEDVEQAKQLIEGTLK